MATDDTFDVMSRVQALLREGKAQEADDLLAALKDKLVSSGAVAAPPPPPPPPPPEPSWFSYAQEAEQLFVAVLGAVEALFMHVGSPPQVQPAIAAVRAQQQRLSAAKPPADAPGPGA